jgi:hypothetical protein
MVESHYVFSYESSGGPHRIAFGLYKGRGGFDGDGNEFNGVEHLVGIAHRIGEGIRDCNPPHFDDIKLVSVEQVGPRKMLWPEGDE